MRCAASLLLVALGCREPRQPRLPDAAAIGLCATDPANGSLIGEIVGVGVNPETGADAYRVRLETELHDTVYVGAGVRPVPCDSVRRAQPRQAPAGRATPPSGS